MKQVLLPLGVFTLITVLPLAAQVHVVGHIGNTFLPAHISIAQGDTVLFQLTSIHNAVEISEASYQSNDSTALPGGFSVPFGGGLAVFNEPGVHYYICPNHAHLGMKGTITVEETTPVSDAVSESVFSIYPNPAGDIISIRVTDQYCEPAVLSFYDMQGRCVAENFRLTGDSGTEWISDIRHLPAGVYFALLQCPQNVMYTRFVKQ